MVAGVGYTGHCSSVYNAEVLSWVMGTRGFVLLLGFIIHSYIDILLDISSIS